MKSCSATAPRRSPPDTIRFPNSVQVGLSAKQTTAGFTGVEPKRFKRRRSPSSMWNGPSAFLQASRKNRVERSASPAPSLTAAQLRTLSTAPYHGDSRGILERMQIHHSPVPCYLSALTMSWTRFRQGIRNPIAEAYRKAPEASPMKRAGNLPRVPRVSQAAPCRHLSRHPYRKPLGKRDKPYLEPYLTYHRWEAERGCRSRSKSPSQDASKRCRLAAATPPLLDDDISHG